MSLFKPKATRMRSPTSNAKDNGPFVNPPRYPQLGGFASSACVPKNGMAVKKPSDGKKVL